MSQKEGSAAAATKASTKGTGEEEEPIVLVFGYGSLLWKQNFPYEAEYDAYIKGYKRVFHQGSPDHRGLPGKPGRVVTLIRDRDPSARVYGKAFQLPPNKEVVAQVLSSLDEREKTGYDRIQVTLYDAHPPSPDVECVLDVHRLNSPRLTSPSDGEEGEAQKKARRQRVKCLCYIATEDNDDYLGEAPLERMAAQILNSHGPSGSNREYLFRLADSLREMGAHDPHVHDLDATARALLEKQAHDGPDETMSRETSS